jgi:hypothetical protein
MVALLVKEALNEGGLAGVGARRCLALAVAGTFCALASVAESAGQSSEDYCGSGELCWSDQVSGAEMKPKRD